MVVAKSFSFEDGGLRLVFRKFFLWRHEVLLPYGSFILHKCKVSGDDVFAFHACTVTTTEGMEYCLYNSISTERCVHFSKFVIGEIKKRYAGKVQVH